MLAGYESHQPYIEMCMCLKPHPLLLSSWWFNAAVGYGSVGCGGRGSGDGSGDVSGNEQT